MQEKSYPYTSNNARFRYEFTSVIDNKIVRKVVRITQTSISNVYNLALFDILADGTLSDISESRNKDLRTVLATVFRIVMDFYTQKPGAFLLFRGSDARRHRLYSIVIAREFNQLSERFVIYGLKNDVLCPFTPNSHFDFYVIEQKL
ncbi:DUF6934 family protein [Dyadobacter fermentans]|uniref:Uncharacterized protein n=1 Tax=Dyadobacter fermentans (strain ATCC 700827 / DSM 18053 / CIP 107007 / KCTC 52180 / NS114) TaxID=471854 RepID=C6W6S2_DYAFD|nr:hypothetical protein [Dyadobacter fermentans]ACT96133.1 conserved hypothetical protein [Dyadobacter fermentans DSM 18053]